MASPDNINLKWRKEVPRMLWTRKPQIGVGVKEIQELVTEFKVKEQHFENNFYRSIEWTKFVAKLKKTKRKIHGIKEGNSFSGNEKSDFTATCMFWKVGKSFEESNSKHGLVLWKCKFTLLIVDNPFYSPKKNACNIFFYYITILLQKYYIVK